MSTEDWVAERPDFKARVRFLSKEEGGRQRAPVLQGIRCDFQYNDKYEDDPPNQVWMIYPAFLDDAGALLPVRSEIPKQCEATFRILNSDLRHVHRARLRPGSKFWLVEGSHRIAEGLVTTLLGLCEDAG